MVAAARQPGPVDVEQLALGGRVDVMIRPDDITFVPETDNEHDPNAVAIWNEEQTLQLGYVPRETAAERVAADASLVSLAELSPKAALVTTKGQGSIANYHPLSLNRPEFSTYNINVCSKLAVGALSGFEYIAILAGDAELARRAVAEHLEGTGALLRGFLE